MTTLDAQNLRIARARDRKLIREAVAAGTLLKNFTLTLPPGRGHFMLVTAAERVELEAANNAVERRTIIERITSHRPLQGRAWTDAQITAYIDAK